MDQLLRLLRATCAYCGMLKMRRVEVNRFCCKLQLVRHGLLKEVKELEEQTEAKAVRGAKAGGVVGSDNAESEDSDEDDTNTLVNRRNDFVKHAIEANWSSSKYSTVEIEKVEAAAEERRMLIKEFLADITKIKTCGSCNGSVIAYSLFMF